MGCSCFRGKKRLIPFPVWGRPALTGSCCANLVSWTDDSMCHCNYLSHLNALPNSVPCIHVKLLRDRKVQGIYHVGKKISFWKHFDLKPELFLKLRRAELGRWWLALQSCPFWTKCHANVLDSMETSYPKALHFSVYVNKGLSFTVIITYTWIFSSEPFFMFSVASFQMLVLGLAVLETRALFFNYYSFTTKLLISRAGVGLSVTSCFCPQKGALGHFGRGRRGLRGSGWVTGGLSVLPAAGNRVSSHARRGRELCPWPTNLQLGLWVWEMSAQMAVLGWQQMLLI